MQLHNASDFMRSNRVQLAGQAAVRCPCRLRTDASSPDTRQNRLSLRSSRLCNHPPVNHPARPCSTGMQLHNASDCMRSNRVQLAGQAAVRCPRLLRADASSHDTRQTRLSLRSLRLCNHPPVNHLNPPMLDGDAVAQRQRRHAIKPRTARWSGGRTLSRPIPGRCKLA